MKFSPAHLKKSSGFTLVELIIVIAILGILAAVVLAAMNPLEQLARGRDAGRISAVSQLGRVMQAYVTNNGSSIPAAANNWQTILTTSKDLTNVVNVNAAPLVANGCDANPSPGTLASTQGNICYGIDASPAATKFVIWTALESQSELLKAGGGVTACAAGRGIVVYDSSRGQTQVGCVPAGGSLGGNPLGNPIGTNPVATYYNP